MTPSDPLIECLSTVKWHLSFLSTGKNHRFRSTQISVSIITRNGVDGIAFYKSSLSSSKKGRASIGRFQNKLFCYHTALPAFPFLAHRFPALPLHYGFSKYASFLIHLNSQIISGGFFFFFFFFFFTVKNKKGES